MSGKKELDRHENGELFDLLPVGEKCDTFRVAFDYYSPRSHFIIVPRDRKSITSFNSLDQGAKLKIVKAAMAMVSHYKLQQLAILSLHFGKWGTDKNKFHGHLYVDVEEYLRIFEQRKKKIPNWPSQEYVTREWKSRNPGDYELNVRRYPFKTYFKDEVNSVREYRRTQPSTSTAGASATPSPPFTILYHPSEPRVGFAVRRGRTRSAEAFLEAQEAKINFASQKNLTNIHATNENDGCHVCLVLDGNTHGFIVEDSQFLVGYIQITGPKFYKDLCPREKQDAWFAKYSAMKDCKVYT